MIRLKCNVGSKDRSSSEELRTRLKLKSMKNVYKIENYNGLVVWKELKRTFGLVHVEPSRVV